MSTNRNREEFGPVTRNRSSSANEASKPILVTQRRQTHVGSKTLNFSPSNGSVVAGKFWHNYFPLEYQRSTIFLTSFDTDFRIEVHKHTQKNTNTQIHNTTNTLTHTPFQNVKNPTATQTIHFPTNNFFVPLVFSFGFQVFL